MPDSLKYKTKLGRDVYGGGGINPDIKIKRDTTLNFKIINKILLNGWIRDFSMQYSDKKRGNIFKITSAKEYLSKIEEIILSQFISYIDNIEKGISEKLNNSDKSYLKKQVKANIARNLWSSKDYYRIIIEDDEYVNTAIKNN